MELKDIFKLAEKTYKENELQYQQKLQETENRKLRKIQEIQDLKNNKIDSEVDYNTECYSKELLSLIKKYNFNIDTYKKEEEPDYEDFCPTLETYYCNYNGWSFTIRNFEDCDIEEGIFSLSDLKNIKTNEEINFYCDLGCRNTGKDKLNNFLGLIKYNTQEEYIKDKYKEELKIPKLLENKGYIFENHNFGFTLQEPIGYLKLDKEVYLKFYRALFDNLKLVITNDKKWNVNSSNDDFSSIGYYFNYTNENDIEELCKCIDCFKDHMKGKIGYYEDETYYDNKYLTSYYNNLMLSIKNKCYDNYNHYRVEIKEKEIEWDGRGYNTGAKIINKYKGLELYNTVDITFNDSAQWSHGDKKNKSVITFIYDKSIDKDNCILTIDNYIYSEDSEIEYCDEELEEYVLKESNNRLEFKGEFTELFGILEQYIDTMCKIHNIDK